MSSRGLDFTVSPFSKMMVCHLKSIDESFDIVFTLLESKQACVPV